MSLVACLSSYLLVYYEDKFWDQLVRAVSFVTTKSLIGWIRIALIGWIRITLQTYLIQIIGIKRQYLILLRQTDIQIDNTLTAFVGMAMINAGSLYAFNR